MMRSTSTKLEWPQPWRPVTDEAEALAFGRSVNPAVASTVLGELRREICCEHPLHGLEVMPLAYDSRSCRDFLFETAQPERRFVLVHVAWGIEPDPRWPFIETYGDLEAFRRAVRRCHARIWEFWKWI